MARIALTLTNNIENKWVEIKCTRSIFVENVFNIGATKMSSFETKTVGFVR